MHRKSAEAALRRLNDSLETTVAQRTLELREMIKGLESFNRSVSHDLRGPLGGIAGVSRLASEALARGDIATTRRMLPLITSQAESSSRLVASLLTLARVGDAELAIELVDLNSFVRQTIDELRHADPSGRPLPVKVLFMPTVQADPALLRQVFVNLVGNALKFSRDVTHPQIEVGSMLEHGTQALFVRDNGVGFDADDADRMFEPFQRLHGQKFQGHGVGLSIVRRVVERHGGRVWATSEPGQGATVLFTLDGAESSAAQRVSAR